jgi:hypothetical protein
VLDVPVAQVRLVGPGTPTDVRAEIQTDRRIQKKPGLRSIPYDSINADMSRIATAEEYIIFLMTSPYEVGEDIAETFIAPPKTQKSKMSQVHLVFGGRQGDC